MGFSSNGLPLGPNDSFPRQRIGNAGTVNLRPVRDVEGRYMENEVAQLPTQEKEYSSVANAAKNHLLFGEVKRQSTMKKMGGGFQREMDRKKLMARPMPGHDILDGLSGMGRWDNRNTFKQLGFQGKWNTANVRGPMYKKSYLQHLMNINGKKGLSGDRDQNF